MSDRVAKQSLDYPELLTSAEVCRVLRISTTALATLVRSGRLKPMQLGTCSTRFVKSQVDALFAKAGA